MNREQLTTRHNQGLDSRIADFVHSGTYEAQAEVTTFDKSLRLASNVVKFTMLAPDADSQQISSELASIRLEGHLLSDLLPLLLIRDFTFTERDLPDIQVAVDKLSQTNPDLTWTRYLQFMVARTLVHEAEFEQWPASDTRLIDALNIIERALKPGYPMQIGTMGQIVKSRILVHLGRFTDAIEMLKPLVNDTSSPWRIEATKLTNQINADMTKKSQK